MAGDASGDASAARASCDMIRRADGPWFGRWGVNYVYGTSGVLRALETIQHDVAAGLPEARRIGCGRCKIADGGFGESILSYYDASLKAKGKSTASQTAWGLIGLLAAVGPQDAAAERAVAWLVAHQNADGTWSEDEFTGTGFPCVFYLKYHLYRNSFPLYALARYDNLRKGRRKFAGIQVPPEEIEHQNGHWG